MSWAPTERGWRWVKYYSNGGRYLETTVTSLTEIQPWVIDRIRGMQTGGVPGVYRQHTYDKEMAAALEKGADALQAILAGESIAD